MRLSTLFGLAGLAASAAADSMVVYVFCTTASCNYMDGRWTTAFGTYYVDSRDGCKDPADVPGLNNLCIDWSHMRGHFYFDNQAKRCLHMDTFEWDASCYTDQTSCYTSRWSEVPCTW